MYMLVFDNIFVMANYWHLAMMSVAFENKKITVIDRLCSLKKKTFVISFNVCLSLPNVCFSG